VTKESLKLLYPRNYSSFVKKYCEEYEISEEIMYALIRTESFFDADIKSSAGAIGLTQLMIPTASDIARKLRVTEYSLENPEQNIQFGTYYISELIHRLDGNVLAAFFSYNAGITRVRRWLKTSKIEFNNTQSLPIDLFLETVPYEETRGYGRKLIGAASLYGWLYYDKPIYEVVSSIVE
jgi:soluble lytic murein transglycosylase